MNKISKILAMLAAGMGAQMASFAAEVTALRHATVGQWVSGGTPMTAKGCKLIHTYGLARRCQGAPKSTYDAPPVETCPELHPGHSGTMHEVAPGMSPSESVDTPITLTQVSLSGIPPSQLQLEINSRALIDAMKRHHGLTFAKYQIQPIRLSKTEVPARLGMQFVFEQPATEISFTAMPNKITQLVGPTRLLADGEKWVVVVRGKGAGSHEAQSPQLRCTFE